MAKRQAASTLQTGKALLNYAERRCPNIKEINLNLFELSRSLARFDDDLYIELW